MICSSDLRRCVMSWNEPHALAGLPINHLGRAGGAHPDAPALGGDELQLEIPGLAVGERALHRLADEGRAVGGEEPQRALPARRVFLRRHLVNAVGLRRPVQLVRRPRRAPRRRSARPVATAPAARSGARSAASLPAGTARLRRARIRARAAGAPPTIPAITMASERDSEQRRPAPAYAAATRVQTSDAGMRMYAVIGNAVQALERDDDLALAEERARPFH